jgi:hypothetical protein
MNDDMVVVVAAVVIVVVVVLLLAEGKEVIFDRFSLMMYPMIKIVGLMMI